MTAVRGRAATIAHAMVVLLWGGLVVVQLQVLEQEISKQRRGPAQR